MNLTTKSKLLEEGHQLLSLVKQQDKGFDIIVDVLEKEHLLRLEKWFHDTEVYVEKYGLDSQIDELKDLSWIINHNRVSVGRVKKIMKLLEIIG